MKNCLAVLFLFSSTIALKTRQLPWYVPVPVPVPAPQYIPGYSSQLNPLMHWPWVGFDRSLNKTWLCGVWLTGDELTAPMANYFNFPTVFRTSCPIKKNTRQFARLCQKVGLNWEKNWTPTKVGFRGTEGDKICGLVKREFGETDVPSTSFPNGIRLGFYYNFCGEPEWTWTGLLTNQDALCCKSGKYVSCNGLTEKSSNKLTITDILEDGESIVPREDIELADPKFFGPEKFVLTIKSDEDVFVNKELNFEDILDDEHDEIEDNDNEDIIDDGDLYTIDNESEDKEEDSTEVYDMPRSLN